jgi:hypothetical protein
VGPTVEIPVWPFFGISRRTIRNSGLKDGRLRSWSAGAKPPVKARLFRANLIRAADVINFDDRNYAEYPWRLDTVMIILRRSLTVRHCDSAIQNRLSFESRVAGGCADGQTICHKRHYTMKHCNSIGKLILTTTVALAAATGTFRVQAQDLIVDFFDTTNTVTAWSATWGTTPTLSFSTNNNDRIAQAAGSGSLRVEAAYFTGAGTWEQAVTQRTLTNAIKASQYETVSVDVRVDPSSVSTPAGQYGYFEIKHGSGGTSFGGVNLTSTNWTTLTWNVPAATPDITEIRIQLGSGDFVGPVIYEMDNFRFNAPRTAINRFDTSAEINDGVADLWFSEWGTATAIIFDPEDAGGSTNATSGSLKASKDNFTPGSDGWEQMVIKIQDFNPAIVSADHSAISVDVKVDPTSVPTTAGQYGYFELKYGSGGVAFGGVNLTRTNWTRYTWNIAAGTADIVQLRVQNGNGEFQGPITYYMDNLVLVQKVGGPTLGILTTPQDDMKRTEVVLNWLLSDGATEINPNSVLLSINGNPAEAAKVTFTKTAQGATVVFDDTGPEYPAGEHQWSLAFSDSSTPANNINSQGTFIVNPYPTEGTFVIEAEDFNYDSGKSNPQKGVADMDVDVMPYLGGAYDTLNATVGIDYNGNDANDSDLYRTELDATGSNAVNMISNTGGRWGTDRGIFTVLTSYRLGWVGGGEWENYTRTFPYTNYNVWGAFSRDSRDPNLIGASLALVSGDITTSNQTTSALGTFSGPGTGGWGRNMLFPMKNSQGKIASVRLDGLQTVRLTHGAGGDFDYLLFVPTGAPVDPPRITGISQSGNNITVTWSGGGVLWSASSLSGPWNSTNDGDGSYSETATGTEKYFRAIIPAF